MLRAWLQATMSRCKASVKNGTIGVKRGRSLHNRGQTLA